MKFLKKLFSKEKRIEELKDAKQVELAGDISGKIVEIYSPLAGTIISLSEIPDDAFASGILGDGVGIEPNSTGDTICSPCDTDEVGIFDTKHAVSMETADGLELIVHFGIDTVQLDGNGFEQLVEGETAANTGDALVKYDLGYIKANAKSVRTPVLINNMDMVESIEKMSGEVKPGDLLMKVKLK